MTIGIRGGTPATHHLVGSSGTALSVTLTGTRQPQNGDLLWIWHGNDFYALSNMPTPSVGGSTTGVALQVTADAGTNQSHTKGYSKPITATGDLTVSVTETGTGDEERMLVVYVLSGADTASPIDGTPSTGFSITSTNTRVLSAISPTNTDSMLFGHISPGPSAGGTGYTPPGAPWVEDYDADSGGGTAFWYTGGHEQLSASGSTGTRTFTLLSSVAEWSGAMVAIKASSGGGGSVSAVDPQDTFLPGASLLGLDGDLGSQPLGLLYQPTPEQVLDFVAPPTAPDFVPQSPNRGRHLWRFRSRSAQPTPSQLEVPPLPVVRNVRPLLRRDAGRTAGPVPDQVIPPTTPSVVPGITTHRPRWLRRRSESAQPVPTQEAAPTNPPIAFLARARRVLFGRRLSDTTEAPLEQPTPPAQAHPRRIAPRLRTSSTAAPVAEQPAVSAPLERRRIAVRRRSGRAATPTPTQQAAPQNPDFGPLNRERVRRLVRRGAGRTAMPTPAQQAAPSNPEIVSAVRALRRRAFRRGPGRTAAPVPAQQTAPQNPAIVFVTRAFRARPLLRGNARTASPVPAQAAPVNPPFVPAGLRRPRRALRRASHVATPPIDQLVPVHAPPAPLRSLLRRARRRIAQVFVFVAPPLGRFITVDVVVGDDRYEIEVGDDRYQVGVGDADRYEVAVGEDRYQVGVGDDRYEIEVE